MKNIFKKLLGLVALFTLLFIFSCTEDLNESNKTDAIHEIKKTKITFDAIKGNQKILNEINSITQKQQEFKRNNKLIYDSANEFYIDTDNIILQEGSLGKSYTFNIIRASESPYVENLTIHIDNQNGSMAILAIYNLTEAEKEIILNGGAITDINQKTLIFPVNGLSTEFMMGYTSKEAPITGITIYQFSNGQCGVIDHIENLGAEGSMIYYTIVPCPVADAGGSGSGSSSSSTTGNFTFGYDYTVNSNNQSTNTSNTSTGGGSSSGNYIIPHVMPADQKKKKEFLMNLDDDQEDCYNSLDNTQKEDILAYIGSLTTIGNNSTNCSNSNTQEEQFNEVEDLMAAMCGNPDMTFDVQKSLKSPANIDFSAIDTTTPDGQKFDCIYNKLAYSCSFENLFVNTFGVNNKINIKFEIVQNLSHTQPDGTITHPNATTHISSLNGNYTNLIKISSNLLNGTKSNFEIAKTILHECIHAYLNIKRANCSQGSTIPEINDLLFPELISSFYQAGCSIDANGADQSEHAFMFDFMIPVFQAIFTEIRDELIPQSQVDYNEDVEIQMTNGTFIEIFNWQNFYKYFSMQGLENNNAFNTEINQNSIEYGKYIRYREIGEQFIKSCQ